MLDAQRLWSGIESLGRITDPERPYTRRSFTARHAEGRAWLEAAFAGAGLRTHVDAGGNLVGRREGSIPGLAPIITGSHSDTVGGGGRFDGIAGLIAGLEVARTLADDGISLRHPFELIDFLAEEPSEFGISCIGSRAMAGELPEPSLQLHSRSGESLAQALVRAGGDPAALGTALRTRGSIAAFFELHIEQGPVLERAGVPVGIVTEIVGIQRLEVVIDGRPDHAGTTPMAMRRDALAGAAELIGWVRKAALESSGGDYFVATVGRLDVEPNNSNVVPARVSLAVDARSNVSERLDEFGKALQRFCRVLASEGGLSIAVRVISDSPPTTCDPRLREILSQVSAERGLATMTLPSGAGHDAVYMARLGPAAMIFIPCREGRSHFADEWTEPRQLADGAGVLLDAVLRSDEILSP